MKTLTSFLALFLLLAAQASGDTRISWYSSWDDGLRAAKASGRPIMLMAAAPQCHGVSGAW